MPTEQEFSNEMQVREIASDLIIAIDELSTSQAKKDAIEYAIKMLNDQLNKL